MFYSKECFPKRNCSARPPKELFDCLLLAWKWIPWSFYSSDIIYHEISPIIEDSILDIALLGSLNSFKISAASILPRLGIRGIVLLLVSLLGKNISLQKHWQSMLVSLNGVGTTLICFFLVHSQSKCSLRGGSSRKNTSKRFIIKSSSIIFSLLCFNTIIFYSKPFITWPFNYTDHLGSANLYELTLIYRVGAQTER